MIKIVTLSTPEKVITKKKLIKPKPEPKKKPKKKKNPITVPQNEVRHELINKPNVKKVVSQPIIKPVPKSKLKTKTIQEQIPKPVVKPDPIQESHNKTDKKTTETVLDAEKKVAKAEEIKKEEKSNHSAEIEKKEKGLEEYKRKLADLINQYKYYPKVLRRLRRKGDVKVRFSINANGDLLNITLFKSSRYRLLNKAAEDAVRRVGKFPKPPVLSGKDKIFVYEITIRFEVM